ncbi:hypothetical protein QQX09_10920 [Demequina sp. SYSU T00192]|uniref:Sigma-70, region 4 n=1 Tax=Demequina litoralis TaxID=3051660 RepID=A0ABT8GBD0_9MICO|nr:sigma-70 region 4 domain-containing protein [Demequina sp. SYSU T00192]MDN4476367.1 hypothetical protein [Demequina sp. SYSU T00192]
MDATFAGLSEGARVRLATDAFLLEGDPDAAERLLHAAALRTATARGSGTLEHRARAVMAELHVRRARRRRRHAGAEPATGVVGVLRVLTPRQRAATILGHVDKLSTGDIAEALGVPEAAAASALRDGTGAVAAALGLPCDVIDAGEEVEVTSHRARGGP